MQSDELHKIMDYFYTDFHAGGRRRRLRVTPEEAVHDAAQELGIIWEDQDSSFVAAVLSEQIQIATAQSVAQKKQAERRTDQSIRAMRYAFRLTLLMHNVMFYLGVALIIVGVLSAFNGKAIAGIILGGVGLTDLIFFLIKEPVEGIHESVGNLMQLRAAYNSYFVQLDQWQLYYDYQADEENFKTKQQVTDLIHQHTEVALNLIQQYCKSTATDREKGTEVS